MTAIILFYYIGNFLGIQSSAYHIANYILSMAIAFKVMYMLSVNEKFKNTTSNTNIIGLFLILLLITIFGIFTFAPLKIPLMQDPVTKTYGIGK